ncbi:MAG: ABC transporter ATP-binding protein, partial [Umezawaea sp.]
RALLVTTTAALVGLVTTVADLAWLVVSPVVVALVLFALLLPSLARRQRDQVMADERSAEVAGTVLVGIRDVVACGAEREAGDEVSAAIDRQAAVSVRVAWANSVRGLVIAVGGFAPLALLVVAAPAKVASGQLTAGAVLGAVVYLSTSVQPALRRLADTTSTVVLRLMVALRRLSEAAPAPAPPAGDEVPDGHGVALRGVTFGWGEHAEPVVRDLDLDLAPGDHLAVVGPSGIGKSTVAALLTGLMAPRAGTVALGGVPVHLVRPAVRHRRIALIPQETYLFTGTVRENLALFTPDATDGELLAAVDAVGATDLVAGLGGLDGALGHAGSGMSAGEAQLLAVARVFACPADLVILDEATSHLDPAAEAKVERAFARRDGVLVVIAHRLSSALRAKRVLVMDGGPPLMGEHADLVRTSPAYAELMQAWLPAESARPSI